MRAARLRPPAPLRLYPGSMDLDRALAFSRYAKAALDGDPGLRAGIESALAAPFDWADRKQS